MNCNRRLEGARGRIHFIIRFVVVFTLDFVNMHTDTRIRKLISQYHRLIAIRGINEMMAYKSVVGADKGALLQ